MILLFTDREGQILKDINVSIKYDDEVKNRKTDAKGVIEINNLTEGTKLIWTIEGLDSEEIIFKESGKQKIEIELPKVNMILFVAGKNNEAMADLIVNFELDGEIFEFKTDKNGKIVFRNVKLFSEVKVFQLFEDEILNIEIYRCLPNKAQYFYVADRVYKKSKMVFKLVDKEGQLIKNTEVRFRYEGTEFEKLTDEKGVIEIKDIKTETSIECKQMLFGKSLPWHKFSCDPEVDEFIIHGEKYRRPSDDVNTYDTFVSMDIKLIDSKQEPIPNAVVVIENGIIEMNKYTNQFGLVTIDNLHLGDNIKVSVDLRGSKIAEEFICKKDGETNELILKTFEPKVLYWIISLAVIVVLAILINNINFSSFNLLNKKSEILSKSKVENKDSLIIHQYSFNAQDTAQKPIINVLFKLLYDDTTLLASTNDTGFVQFNNIKDKIPLQVDASLIGYDEFNNRSFNFKKDSSFTIQLQKTDSIKVITNPLSCGELVQSNGDKVTILSIKMKDTSGRFKLFYNMFDLPDQIEVYNGSFYDIHKHEPIYTSEKKVSGIKSLYLNFSHPDSLITIKIIGGEDKTNWLFKVFCNRLKPVNLLPKKETKE